MTKVTIFSTQFCPWCVKTKAFFKMNNVEYVDRNVAEDEKAAQEMVEKSGQRSVPVIEIDGKIIIGFDEKQLRKSLKLKEKN
jgi:glutaredoxin-like YruB-family protein